MLTVKAMTFENQLHLDISNRKICLDNLNSINQYSLKAKEGVKMIS